MTTQRLTQQLLLSALCLGLFAGCATYKPEIAQGNIVRAAQVATLKSGMSRQQVQQALGSPLLQDVFNSSRWDYVYRTLSGKGAIEQRVLTVFFDANNTVTRWAGQEAPSQVGLNSGANVAVIAPAALPSAGTSVAEIALLLRDVATLGVNTAVIDIATTPISVVAATPIVSAVLAPVPAAVVSASTPSATQAAPAADAVSTEVQARIESWRSAWESKDINRYASHYASDYKGEASNNAAWLSQRKRIMEDAGAIALQVSNFNIIQTANDEARASFTQSYQSRRLTESGEKSLFFKRVGNEWKITAERFIKQN
jgi:outer membrane protein assembly factor BamE (lipoprotein component of BamABCDE complex)